MKENHTGDWVSGEQAALIMEALGLLGAPIKVEEVERIIPDSVKHRMAESLEAERMEFLDSYGKAL